MLDDELWGLVARVGKALAPGMTTRQIDDELSRGLAAIGATSTYPTAGFPMTNAVGVDEEIANGVPSSRKVAVGALVKLDTSVLRAGAFATAAWTFRVGGGDVPLTMAGKGALRAAIAQLRVGSRTGDVSYAIQARIEASGFTVVKQLVGYAIVDGKPSDPQLPCFGTPGLGRKLRAGQRFAVHVLAHSGAKATMRDQFTLVAEPGERGIGFTATVDVGEQHGVIVGGFPGFA